MVISATDVKKLREETDAPMMECRAALEEAKGDFEKAKEILREKGKAAAAKRVGRSTSAGVVAFSSSPDKKTVSGIVLESETDFVARNEEFANLAQQIADAFLTQDPGKDPLSCTANGKTIGTLIEEAVGKIRENIKLTKAVRITGKQPVAFYLHHDKTKGAILQLESTNDSDLSDVGRQLAIQSVAFPPLYISKEEVPKDLVEKELEVETQRAIHEGKKPEIARNIAQGRLNKEFFKRIVLLEQPFYKEPDKSVATFLTEESKARGSDIKVVSCTRLAVGEE
jgi:elongation factor Ts